VALTVARARVLVLVLSACLARPVLASGDPASVPRPIKEALVACTDAHDRCQASRQATVRALEARDALIAELRRQLVDRGEQHARTLAAERRAADKRVAAAERSRQRAEPSLLESPLVWGPVGFALGAVLSWRLARATR